MSEGLPTERFGPYLVYEQLGAGGMAQVHRAIAADSDVQRPVALKRMLPHIAGKEEMVKSFVREARLASFMRHENVPQTYDLGKVGDIYFIAMELITGRNLHAVLRHCAATTGPMPVPVALHILNQICDALHYAHNLCDETGQPLGIIHRDVSPSNVIVSDSGVVKLIDFGIAKASAAGLQTASGKLKGKFAYIAPEYLAGQIDARADLFAVGVIAHELLTNRPLFASRDDLDTLRRVRDMHIDPPSRTNPQVPPQIDEVVMTALARDPARRWQHATALRNALTTLTRRLGLVATHAQVIQWLDWAFTHEAPPGPHDDTETDTEADAEPPSRPAEQRTVDLMRLSHRITRVRSGGLPEPPTTEPLGTPVPGSMQPAPRTGLADGEPSGHAAASRAAADAGAPAMTQPSAPHHARAPSASGPPAGQPASRPAALARHPEPPEPGLDSAPLAALRPARPSQAPGVMVASVIAPEQLARRGHVRTVLLIVLAATAAVATIYFVVPLLN